MENIYLSVLAGYLVGLSVCSIIAYISWKGQDQQLRRVWLKTYDNLVLIAYAIGAGALLSGFILAFK